MDKLEINTEKQQYLLNGEPIKFPTEITIKISPNNLPEVKLTVLSELDIKLKDCDLIDAHKLTEIIPDTIKASEIEKDANGKPIFKPWG